MTAEIITIGDELLIGQVIDTNSSWISEQLTLIGLKVLRRTAVGDSAGEILKVLNEAEQRSDVILITGGLGPTNDDITKEVLCEYFDSHLVTNHEALERITAFFQNKGLPMLEVNSQQASVPHNCQVLQNLQGTASGMWFERNKKVFVAMPGVPYEMKAMMEKDVLPKIQNCFNLGVIVHETILTQGVGESMLAEKIQEWEKSLSNENIGLAYLPAPGQVRLRMSAHGKSRPLLQQLVKRKKEELLELIAEHVFGFGKETLAEVLGKILLESKTTLTTAESCTGGYLAHQITAVPGASNYYKGGFVTYSNSLKTQLLDIGPEQIAEFGVVSEQVVTAMAKSVREKYQSDYALATTGFAGPIASSENEQVGLIWIAAAGPGWVVARKLMFGKSRERNILMASNAALNLLRKEILVRKVE